MNAMQLLMSNLSAMCADGNCHPVQVDDNTVKIVQNPRVTYEIDPETGIVTDVIDIEGVE